MSKYIFKGKRVDNNEIVFGNVVTKDEDTYIVCSIELDCSDAETTDLYATEWYKVFPESISLCTEDTNNKLLAEALLRAGSLVGVVHIDNDIGVVEKSVNDYLIVTLLGQLLEKGEIDIKVPAGKIEYLQKLLKCNK